VYPETLTFTKMQLKRHKLTKAISFLYSSKFQCNGRLNKTSFLLSNTEKHRQAI